ncbi:hypothetical protein LZ31DRAFT_347533 [Colletotrichum somersetense]|nr:hypothetical protein LZ31DRAFT_347533 [Colletotrichum somersetense]
MLLHLDLTRGRVLAGRVDEHFPDRHWQEARNTLEKPFQSRKFLLLQTMVVRRIGRLPGMLQEIRTFCLLDCWVPRGRVPWEMRGLAVHHSRR